MTNNNKKKYLVTTPTLGVVATLDSEEHPHAPLISQLVFGEAVKIIAEEKGWAKIISEDNYEGFVSRQGLTDDKIWLQGDDYMLARPMVTIYHEADIKSAPLQLLFYPARINVISKKGNFFGLASGGYVLQNHARPRQEKQSPLDVAKMLMGAPYLWGGRSFGGIDCSGLVQVAYRAAGIILPRDSGLQYNFLKNNIAEEQRQAGDLVFWQGHVGMMDDKKNIIHANAADMAVAVGDYETLRAKLEKEKTLFRGIKRVA